MDIARSIIAGIALVVLTYALAIILARWSFTAPFFERRRDTRDDMSGDLSDTYTPIKKGE